MLQQSDKKSNALNVARAYYLKQKYNKWKFPERKFMLPEDWFYDENGKHLFLDTFALLCKLYHYKITRNENFKLDISEEFRQKLRFFYWFLTKEKTVKGLYVFGTYGSGKTMTLWALAEMLKMYYDEEYHETDKREWEYRMITPGALMEEYKEIADEKNKIEFQKLKSIDLLIIDDIGSEASTVVNVWGNKVRPVENIIEHRYSRGLWTWVTSNYSLKQLAERYSGYIIDRLREMHFVHYTWDSYRN